VKVWINFRWLNQLLSIATPTLVQLKAAIKQLGLKFPIFGHQKGGKNRRELAGKRRKI